MPYLNSDDNYPEHPKVWQLTDAAYRLHNSAMHHAAKHTTDGALQASKIPKLVPKYRAVLLAQLIDAGLVHEPGVTCDSDTCAAPSGDDYVLHDFLQWNKSKEWWTAKRKKDAERQAKWRGEHESQR